MNFTRREVMQRAALFAASACVPQQLFAAMSDQIQWYMPEESGHHQRTWMAFVASDRIWAVRQISEVKRNLASIARNIAQFEPVSMLVHQSDYDLAESMLGGLDAHPYPVSLVEFSTNDLWLRDTGPTFVFDKEGNSAAVDFNFNGWGEDQEWQLDAKVAGHIASLSKATHLQSSLVLEGGCFEIDGAGTAIMTESCILNSNRNPGKSKAEVEEELKRLLGLKKIIWLKGIKGRDITDGHTDFYARFVKPGVVMVSRDIDPESYDYQVTRENIKVLEQATDAAGNPLRLVILDTPTRINKRFGTRDFAAGYVGYYVCNGAVIMQKFGDREADASAFDKIAAEFPDREIVQITIDGIASGGGSVHCTTQQQPAMHAA